MDTETIKFKYQLNFSVWNLNLALKSLYRCFYPLTIKLGTSSQILDYGDSGSMKI